MPLTSQPRKVAASTWRATDQRVSTASPATRDLRTLPKAHLHLHLEAGQRPAMLRELLQRHALETPPPADGTFAGFSLIANIVFRALHRPDEYIRLLREVAEDAAAEGAVWLEPAVWIT